MKRTKIRDQDEVPGSVGVTLEGWRGPLKELTEAFIDKPCSYPGWPGFNHRPWVDALYSQSVSRSIKTVHNQTTTWRRNSCC